MRLSDLRAFNLMPYHGTRRDGGVLRANVTCAGSTGSRLSSAPKPAPRLVQPNDQPRTNHDRGLPRRSPLDGSGGRAAADRLRDRACCAFHGGRPSRRDRRTRTIHGNLLRRPRGARRRPAGQSLVRGSAESRGLATAGHRQAGGPRPESPPARRTRGAGHRLCVLRRMAAGADVLRAITSRNSVTTCRWSTSTRYRARRRTRARSATRSWQCRSRQARRNVVLFGYSKGSPDALDAVVRLPRDCSSAWPPSSVSRGRWADRRWPSTRNSSRPTSSSTGQRPHATRATAAPLRACGRTCAKPGWPRTSCRPGYATTRVVTLPDRERISRAVAPTYKKLAKIDARNDGQVIYTDQIIPGSTLVGFLNADHWAVVVPIDRAHNILGSTVVNHNDYPREALLEALLRYVEEDLAASRR